MPPKKKQQESKKAVQKKQQQMIEDKTFGLKNKNKSKSVQVWNRLFTTVNDCYASSFERLAGIIRAVKYINTVQKSVKSSEAQRNADAAKSRKMAAKEAKKAQEAELAALFNEALAGGPKKGGVAGRSREEAVAVTTKPKKAQETVVIEEGEKTLEDLIEEQRAKLHAEGKKGTPVNEETLVKWKEDRRARKRAEERKKVEAEMKKKSKGKGLSVLSGRALFDYDSTLFEDDANAMEDGVMAQRNDEEAGEETKEGGDYGGHEEVKGEPARGAGEAGTAAAGVTVEESLFEQDEDLDDLDDDET